jgi:hypothetical protein
VGNFKMMQEYNLRDLRQDIAAANGSLTLEHFVLDQPDCEGSFFVGGDHVPHPLKLRYRGMADYASQLEDAVLSYDDERAAELTGLVMERSHVTVVQSDKEDLAN